LEKLKQTSPKSEYVQVLENLKNYLQKNKPKEIADNYFDYVKRQKKQNIVFLKESVNATQQLFAYEETKSLYNELINLEPTAEQHFEYAFFLQKFNFIDDAIKQYEEALRIYRKLAEENPRTYLPDVAMTLTNLAIFYIKAMPDKEKSIDMAMKAVEILLPVYEQVPYLENYLKTALQVLEANGVDINDLLNN